MKIRTLRVLTLSLAACLAPSAFAAVTLNGEIFNSVTTSLNANGEVILTTNPAAVVLDAESKPVPIPALTSLYQVTVEKAVAGVGDTTVTVISDGIELEVVNCKLPDRAGVLPYCPAPIASGGSTECGVTYFETLDWKKIPMSSFLITTGIGGTASKFKTTESTTYKGYFSAVADTLSGPLTRKMWFSECKDGVAVKLIQNYPYKTGFKNACMTSGYEPKLTWTQDGGSSSITACKLLPNREYFLNYKQEGDTVSKNSKMYRGGNYNYN